MSQQRVFCIDPGHGTGNKSRGVFDPGTCFGTYQEATIVMEWANELRGILMERGHGVVRTRKDAKDPAPVSRRDDIARAYGCEKMISLHCNSSGSGTVSGVEVFYRGADDKALAAALSARLAGILGIPDRGPKTEKDSQHTALAVMEFEKCWLIELGFLNHPADRAKMCDAAVRLRGCEAIADLITA